MSKRWIINPEPPAEFISAHPELPAVVAHLLWNRQLTSQEEIDEFLNPDYNSDIHDPFLFKEMEKAVAIILDSVNGQENIIIHGDYDADGVTASALLVSTLRQLGGNNIKVFIPHREIDGYGLNVNTVKQLYEDKTNLIITCDCGIGNIEEIKMARELGMKVIVTDHHVVPTTLPVAEAIIHPLVPGEPYPDKGLSGGGVAFKLVQGLLRRHQDNHKTLRDGKSHESFEKWSLDLAAIALIGDMMPLVGEARTMTKYGLTVLNKTHNLGLRKLMLEAGITDETGATKSKRRTEITAETVGFQIVPRINAAGRMDHANTAFALLVAEDESEAARLAKQLCKNNSDRQKLTEQLVNQAHKQIKETKQTNSPIIIVTGDGWGTGILGLIAGKLKDEFYRPVIVMDVKNGEVTGSGRSIFEFNLMDALNSLSPLFEKFGGHPQACGFSLLSPDNIPDFKAGMIQLATEKLKDQDLSPTLRIDAEVSLENINWELYDLIQKFAPFGQKNDMPRYCAKGLTIKSIEPVGQDGKHLKLMVTHHTALVKKTIGFGLGDTRRFPEDWRNNLKTGDKIDLAFTVGVNEWNGNRELQLSIDDLKKL